MARRNDHSREEIKQMVLDEAERLAAEHGPGFLTARRVSSGIGYTVASIYLVFKNLDDLAMQVNARTLERLCRQLEQAVCSHPEARLNIIEFGRGYLRFAANHPHLWKMLFEARSSSKTPIPDWYRRQILQPMQILEPHLADLRPDLGAESVRGAARALWSGIHGICILSNTGRLDISGIGEIESACEEFCEYFIAGWSDAAKSGAIRRDSGVQEKA